MDELSSREVCLRLVTEGWISREGQRHIVFKHPDRPNERIVVPRHRTLSIGVARQIAKIAGWR